MTVTTSDVGSRAWSTVAIAAAVGALVSLDTMVNIAFPAITDSFGIEVSDIQWLVTTYVLTFASLLLAAGRLSDAFGHRRVLAVGLVLTAVGLGLCGVAHEYGWFLMARVVQGAGATLAMGATPALITLAVPEDARNRAMGYFQMGAAIGLAIGPAVGGALVEVTSWRSVYLLRVPVALVVLGLVVRIVPEPAARDLPPRGSRESLDLPGALLIGAGLAAGLLALTRGGTSGWTSPLVLVGLVAAVALLGAWVAVERRSTNPVIDLSLLRNTPFTIANVLNVVANGTMFAIWLLTPYYLVTVRGLSTIAGGLMLGIAPLATAVAAPLAGRLLGRVGTARLSTVGLTVEAAGLVAVAFTGADTPLVLVAGAFALVGVGLGLFAVPNLLFVMGSIPRDRQGVAGALSQMMRMVGVVAGVAGATLLFDTRRSTHVADLAVAADAPAAFVAAYRDTFAVVGALCAAAIAVSLLRASQSARTMPDERRQMVAVPELSADDRAALQRRVLRVLGLGQIVGGAALASAVTIGAFVVQDMLGDETPWAGIATATTTTGTAFMSQVLARRMTRRGRRPGLQLGYAFAVLGGVVAAIGIETGSLLVFLLGLFLFGNGQAANLLARYAATDLAEPDERSRAMSRIVFASTFGAVFGPVLVGPAEEAGEAWFGLETYTGPWLLSAVLFALAMVNIAIRLRPDPLVASGAEMHPAAQPRVSDGLRTIAASSGARLALTAMVVSQVTMVAVMAMTPVHLKLHGHEGVSQYVISLHIAGMFAFSPLVGRYADRRGRLPAIFVGSIVLTASTVLAALSGDVEQLLFPSLWLLGLGWNFGLIGGSSLLVDSVPAERRVGVQGTADLLMSFCGGMAGFASGFVRRSIGFHLLATSATLAAGLLLVVASTALRRPAPARADGVPAPAPSPSS